MGLSSALGSLLTSWYFAVLAVIGLGVAAGLLIFVYVFPGQPKIGVIDIPFTVINDNTAYVITEYLNYARRDDSIKAVVVKITSPGGGAAASERLYLETRRLREEKPVIFVMNGLNASGGYMMAMGATHTYAQTTSLVGSVGVVTGADPLIPPNPDEGVLITGPHKLQGFSRMEWVAAIEDLKDIFAQIVITERGEKLRITEDDLVQGDLYHGVRAVRLGLVDELGGDSEAFDKAAELAGIANYGLVDVNLEVLKKFIKDFEDVIPTASAGQSSPDLLALMDENYAGNDPDQQSLALQSNGSLERLEALRGLMLYGRLGVSQHDPLPGLPYEMNHPNIYYLYLGYAP